MSRHRIAPGEWGQGAARPAATERHRYNTPTIKSAKPVHPHTSFGRSVCNGQCPTAGCRKPTAHVFRDDHVDIYLDTAPVENGPYVLELDPHRMPMAAFYDEAFHVGWLRYQAHVCATDKP